MRFFILLLVLCFSMSGNFEIQAQKKNPEIVIHYLGHSSFLIKFYNGVSILTDYGKSKSCDLNSPIYGFGDFLPDIALYSHSHHIDHAGGKLPGGVRYILKDSGDLSIKGIDIKSIRTCEKTTDSTDNSSFLITYKGYKILHLGDAQAYIRNCEKENIKEKIKNTYPDNYDLVLLPIGYIKDITSEASKFAELIQAKCLIPMHYWDKKDKEKFLNLINKSGKFQIKKNLKSEYNIFLSDIKKGKPQVISLEAGPFIY